MDLHLEFVCGTLIGLVIAALILRSRSGEDAPIRSWLCCDLAQLARAHDGGLCSTSACEVRLFFYLVQRFLSLAHPVRPLTNRCRINWGRLLCPWLRVIEGDIESGTALHLRLDRMEPIPAIPRPFIVHLAIVTFTC